MRVSMANGHKMINQTPNSVTYQWFERKRFTFIWQTTLNSLEQTNKRTQAAQFFLCSYCTHNVIEFSIIDSIGLKVDSLILIDLFSWVDNAASEKCRNLFYAEYIWICKNCFVCFHSCSYPLSSIQSKCIEVSCHGLRHHHHKIRIKSNDSTLIAIDIYGTHIHYFEQNGHMNFMFYGSIFSVSILYLVLMVMRNGWSIFIRSDQWIYIFNGL